jgi:hypothetical protein
VLVPLQRRGQDQVAALHRQPLAIDDGEAALVAVDAM